MHLLSQSQPYSVVFKQLKMKDTFSVFYSCLLCAWSNKSIHWFAFPTLAAGHPLLYLFESSWSVCYYELPRRRDGCYLSQIITLYLPPLPSLWTLTTYITQRAKSVMSCWARLWLMTDKNLLVNAFPFASPTKSLDVHFIGCLSLSSGI